MKKFVLFLLVCATSLSAASINWYSDFSKARKVAEKEDKPMFLFFTGSDWCGYCMKLKKEVLDTAAFAKAEGDRWIFVDIDFPMHKAQSGAIKRLNKKLADEFGVTGYPTVILLEPNTKKIAEMGYEPGGAENYIKKLDKIMSYASDLEQKIDHLNDEAVAAADLKELYQQAVVLGREAYAGQILAKGLEESRDAFFLAEKYRDLVRAGEGTGKEALAIRDELLALDPNNEAGQHLTLAVLDFQQALADESLPLEERIRPLTDYLRTHDKEDQDRWRVQITLAQYLSGEGQTQEAAEYARGSLSSAPGEVQPDIERFLASLD